MHLFFYALTVCCDSAYIREYAEQIRSRSRILAIVKPEYAIMSFHRGERYAANDGMSCRVRSVPISFCLPAADKEKAIGGFQDCEPSRN
jgi:hypothetical protein